MIEFDLNGQKYRVGTMNAITQFHVTRRLGPALVICGATFKMLMDGMHVSLDDWTAVAGPVMDVVSHMSDEDVEYVIFACMRTVERAQGDRWAPVAHPKEPVLMFADMDMADMLRVTVEVLRDKLANFAKGMTADGSTSEGSGAAVRP